MIAVGTVCEKVAGPAIIAAQTTSTRSNALSLIVDLQNSRLPSSWPIASFARQFGKTALRNFDATLLAAFLGTGRSSARGVAALVYADEGIGDVVADALTESG